MIRGRGLRGDPSLIRRLGGSLANGMVAPASSLAFRCRTSFLPSSFFAAAAVLRPSFPNEDRARERACEGGLGAGLLLCNAVVARCTYASQAVLVH